MGASRVCSPGSWGRSGDAIGEFGVLTQPLAAADPAGVRTRTRAMPAGLRDNEAAAASADLTPSGLTGAVAPLKSERENG